jgi:adenosylhomocysteine nucleosidase
VAAELNTAAAEGRLPCILFALQREAMIFRRWFPARRRLRASPCPAAIHNVEGTAVLVAITGVGIAATEAALGWLLHGYRPSSVIAAGFCGALDPGLRVGEVVAPREVLVQDGRRWAPSIWSDRRLACRDGPLLSIDRVVSDPQDRMRLAAETGASAVDMESATVARRCEEHGLSWLCLRAVSDDAGTLLPAELASVLAGGQVAPLRLAAAVLRRPGLVRHLWRLARDTRLAAQSLALAVSSPATRHPPRESDRG